MSFVRFPFDVHITIWGVHLKINWNGRNAFICAGNSISLNFNFFSNFIEIREFFIFTV